MSEKTVAKDSIFCKKHSLNLGGKLMTLDKPLIMGILNITPDSFHDGGKYNKPEAAVERCRKMLDEGAGIIDIGASSTRPGAAHTEASEEIKRFRAILPLLKREFPEAIFSIDTYQAEVARATAGMGAHIINDISGGTMDADMPKTMGELKLPYILMHIKGTPATMQKNPVYTSVFDEVSYFFSEQIERFLEYGVADIILDPGFGFAKNLDHNYELLSKLELLQVFERPLLLGVSRKGMIQKITGTTAENALNGSTVVHTIALQKGANILRVHDVKEAVEVLKILTFTQNFS